MVSGNRRYFADRGRFSSGYLDMASAMGKRSGCACDETMMAVGRRKEIIDRKGLYIGFSGRWRSLEFRSTLPQVEGIPMKKLILYPRYGIVRPISSTKRNPDRLHNFSVLSLFAVWGFPWTLISRQNKPTLD